MPSTAAFGSDIVVDFLIDHGIRFVALNPGSSFRGLHDSIVNHGEPRLELIECTHEKTAVGLAHGYAKATGEPMAVAIHDLVGLMQATMGVYMAQTDQLPILLLGGAGPMDEAKRRPWIDWVHTANMQNDLVRNYTKWDDHPYSVAAFGPSLARAYRQMLQAPQGPVYVALDAALQEESITGLELGLKRASATPLPTRIGAEAGALETVHAALQAAERPIIVGGFVQHDATSWDALQGLCEYHSIAVYDSGLRLAYPNSSPLWVTTPDIIGQADLVILLNVKDPAHKTGLFHKTDLEQVPNVDPAATVITIGLNEIGRKAWTNHEGLLFTTHHTVTCEWDLAITSLLGMIEQDARPAPDRTRWRETLAGRNAKERKLWAARVRDTSTSSPVATAALASETWRAIKDFDWVLSAGTASDWAYRTWDFDRYYRHPGRSLGTATQFAISLGVALAHRDKGRLVVSLQPDGDLLFDLAGMWTAKHYNLPLLCVMFNNRAYYNDLGHQVEVAHQRQRPEERAWIGLTITHPEPDFAAIARGFDWHAEGPITESSAVRDAVRRAAEHVVSGHGPALVDVVCEYQ